MRRDVIRDRGVEYKKKKKMRKKLLVCHAHHISRECPKNDEFGKFK